VGLEVFRAVSRASSTLEGSLQCQDIGPSHPIPMEVAEDPSALEMATAEDPAPEGVAGSDPALVGRASCNPAPEGVLVGSLSHTSMDVHVGSSPPRSEGATTVRASTTLNEPVALEVGNPVARNLLSTGGAGICGGTARIIPA
jgi:hypothetical protein